MSRPENLREGCAAHPAKDSANNCMSIAPAFSSPVVRLSGRGDNTSQQPEGRKSWSAAKKSIEAALTPLAGLGLVQ
eukprot:198573-Rhodomonas_salina.1